MTAAEQSVFESKNRITELSGQIARIQTELLLKKGVIDDALSNRISDVIGRCQELTVNLQLGQKAEDAGIYNPAPPADPAGKAAGGAHP